MQHLPANLDHQRAPRSRPRISRPVWLLIAATCAFVEFAGHFATGGRVSSWNDILFIILFAVLGLIALFNGLRPPPPRTG